MRFPSLPRGLAITMSVLGAVLLLGENFSSAPVKAQGPDQLTSWPPDLTHYARPLSADEIPDVSGAGLPPSIFVRDVVVSNTDPTLFANDTAPDGETSIAINPLNTNEIVISAFSGSWGANTLVWHTLDGGFTWSRQFTIPSPLAGTVGNCPCDQAFDFSRGGRLGGTFLIGSLAAGFNVVSGLSTNITNAANWLFNNLGVPLATQLTNNNVATSINNSDQPWLLVNPDPTTTTQDNVYVAYDDFSGGPDMQVAVSNDVDANPAAALNFGLDVQVGQSTAGVNPGLRLADDPRTGFMYALWQRCIGVANCNTNNPKNIDYMLNRSTDGGATWPLGGGNGIVVANANSTQPRPKFGTVNALLGGVLHAAVDPNTGDLYYAYGSRDGVTGNDRLAMRRITFDVNGNPVVGGEVFINGQVESAIPSVAVASDGTVGVFYYTFDGFSSDAFPRFSAHVAFSRDQGSTWATTTIQSFLSSAQDSGNTGQRVLGDYMQMKTVGRTFYGSYTGNGATFGRPVSNHDPIFFKATVGPKIDTTVTSDFGDVCSGDSKTTKLQIFNTGIDDLLVYSVARVSGSADINVTSGPAFPAVVAPGSHIDYDITCAPTAVGPISAVIRITSNDPDRPTIDITHTCDAPPPDAKIQGSGAFGQVCGAAQAEKEIKICNVGACNLNVTSATIDCPDFTVVDDPFPAPVSKDFCLPIVVKFTPTSPGPKSCKLTITTDDPDQPEIVVPLTGNTPAASIDVPFPLGQAFPPGVVQSIGSCKVPKPFPISNTGTCPLTITNVAIGGTNAGDFDISGLPSFPIILEPGHIAGEGDLKTVFAATALDRDREGTLTVTYVSDPVAGTTTNVVRNLCGEGVNTGARILVNTGAGVPYAVVKQIQVHRLVGQKQKVLVDTASVSKNLPLVTVNPASPCPQIKYHKELGTVANPIMLAPGSYTVTATVISATTGKNVKKTVAFDVQTCTFNPNIVIVIP